MGNGEIHSDKFSLALSKLTGISQEKLTTYFNNNEPYDLFKHPDTLTNITQLQRHKLDCFRECIQLCNMLRVSENKKYRLNTPKLAGEYFSAFLGEDRAREKFVCAFLNKYKEVIKCEIMFEGTINQSIASPREIIKSAMKYQADSVILAHNHPSSDPDPSTEDKEATKRISAALSTINVNTLDHVIVGSRNNWFSFKERGLEHLIIDYNISEKNRELKNYPNDKYQQIRVAEDNIKEESLLKVTHNQLEYDEKRFIEILSKLTRIDGEKLKVYIKDNNIQDILDGPNALNITSTQKVNLKNIIASVEMSNSIISNNKKPFYIKTSRDVYSFVDTSLSTTRDKESFTCLFLNTKNMVEKSNTYYKDSSEYPVSPNNMVKTALKYDANSVIMIHNNPNKGLILRGEDEFVVKKLSLALKIVGIKTLDHILVNQSGYQSCKEKGVEHFEPEIGVFETKKHCYANIITEDQFEEWDEEFDEQWEHEGR